MVFLCSIRNRSPCDFSKAFFFFCWKRPACQSRIQTEMQQERGALLAAGGCWNETGATRSQSLDPLASSTV